MNRIGVNHYSDQDGNEQARVDRACYFVWFYNFQNTIPKLKAFKLGLLGFVVLNNSFRS